jgi:hypothetical protein
MLHDSQSKIVYENVTSQRSVIVYEILLHHNDLIVYENVTWQC